MRGFEADGARLAAIGVETMGWAEFEVGDLLPAVAQGRLGGGGENADDVSTAGALGGDLLNFIEIIDAVQGGDHLLCLRPQKSFGMGSREHIGKTRQTGSSINWSAR